MPLTSTSSSLHKASKCILCSTMLQHTTLACFAPHPTTPHCTTPHYITLHCSTQHCTKWHYTLTLPFLLCHSHSFCCCCLFRDLVSSSGCCCVRLKDELVQVWQLVTLAVSGQRHTVQPVASRLRAGDRGVGKRHSVHGPGPLLQVGTDWGLLGWSFVCLCVYWVSFTFCSVPPYLLFCC